MKKYPVMLLIILFVLGVSAVAFAGSGDCRWGGCPCTKFMLDPNKPQNSLWCICGHAEYNHN